MWSRLAVMPRRDPPWKERIVGSTPVVQEGADGVARGVRGESVGENLVHHRVFPPVRGAGGVVGGRGDDHAVAE